MVHVIAQVPRERCVEHRVVVAGVPWARHGARHTLAFEQLAAGCAVEMSATAASKLLRCTWRTIGGIVARAASDLDDEELLHGVRRIGIDEISGRRNHRYLLVVVDHDRRRIIHPVDGANKKTLGAFFDRLGTDGSAEIAQLQVPLLKRAAVFNDTRPDWNVVSLRPARCPLRTCRGHRCGCFAARS
jgi:transposase